MNKNFISGFLSGLAGSLIIFTIALTVYVTQVNSNDDSGNAGITAQENKTSAKEDSSSDTDKVIEKIDKLELLINKYYLEDVDDGQLADGIYKGLMSSLKDPYSCYYTKEEYAALQESTSGTYSGIGATVSADVDTGAITIVKPFANGAAHEAGILPGDIIYKIDGEEVTGEDLTEVVSKIKGKVGSKVDLVIIREGEEEPLNFTITRKQIEVPTIEYEMMDNKIGYIAVAEFDEVTADQFRSAIDDLEKQGMKGLVIDLRDNPGGLLETVVDMLNRMLPKGLIVYTEDKNGVREEQNSDAKESFDKPLAVLINGNSASASEIFAGAIQDYKLGTIVGTTSFGKGIVQSVIPLNDGTAIKVTVSKYYTPNGKNIHGIGITPDVKVELSDKLKKKVVIEKDEDNQLQKAISVVKDKINKK